MPPVSHAHRGTRQLRERTILPATEKLPPFGTRALKQTSEQRRALTDEGRLATGQRTVRGTGARGPAPSMWVQECFTGKQDFQWRGGGGEYRERHGREGSSRQGASRLTGAKGSWGHKEVLTSVITGPCIHSPTCAVHRPVPGARDPTVNKSSAPRCEDPGPPSSAILPAEREPVLPADPPPALPQPAPGCCDAGRTQELL